MLRITKKSSDLELLMHYTKMVSVFGDKSITLEFAEELLRRMGEKQSLCKEVDMLHEELYRMYSLYEPENL